MTKKVTIKDIARELGTTYSVYNGRITQCRDWQICGPGYYATAQTAPIRVGGHTFNEFFINRTPAGRWGQPEELQRAVIFPGFSKASDFVNGHVLYVDGGILATLG